MLRRDTISMTGIAKLSGMNHAGGHTAFVKPCARTLSCKEWVWNIHLIATIVDRNAEGDQLMGEAFLSLTCLSNPRQ